MQATEPLRWRAWLVFGALVIHVAEELPKFPAWATQYFGTTTTTFFVISHAPIFILFAWICRVASGEDRQKKGTWWLTTAVFALAANGIFHVTSTIAFGAYSPGVVSAVLIYLPMSVYLIPKLKDRLSRNGFALAILSGIVAASVITGSLVLDMPF